MKKLNKLVINSGRILKSDELLSLRGGTGTCGYHCWHSQGADYHGCGYSLSEVNEIMAWYEESGYECNWCCDSCDTSTYCGGY
jgi:hypothetical protein